MASAGRSSSASCRAACTLRRLLRATLPSLTSLAFVTFAVAAAAAAALALAPAQARAQTAELATAPAPLIEVRLALSDTAARTLFEPRMRRLVQIETEGFAVLATSPVGPLGDRVADVWVDQPTSAKVIVEARIGERAVEHREIAVRGLASDVAARLVALAIADLVRTGSLRRPSLPALTPPKLERSAEELERAYRVAPALTVSGGVEGAVLPAGPGGVGGSSLEIGFRRFAVSESIFGRWLEGASQGTSLRWLELGIGVQYRLWLTRSLRLAVGAEGAFASVHLGDALAVEGEAGQLDGWSARAGARFGLELRAARPLWLALAFAPSAILRPVPFDEASAPSSGKTLGGAWLGVSLGAIFEYVAGPDARARQEGRLKL